MSEWYNADYIVPHDDKPVLATDGKEIEIMIYYANYKGSSDWSSMCIYSDTLDVRYWMPLPPLPMEMNERNP